ncbi:phosphoribosyltransferase-like protein [Cellulomonas oligotrophica]|uniref:PRTase-CE domain-containing protein n=1 Tax=Cellulomonas oligotrophica TaxID=931536 RepID=A0A7Y9FJT2_9CELL|nr:hypothetical protein [Cellulomonas oligotrophica]NYD87346.1 hypothetical protein [Cellulomonas oligotrophica]GIG34265.1 hypothetical protein Col01nite_34240 [Cellulomonas oligotrophica]
MDATHEAALIRDIKTLSERVWERRVQEPDIERWLSNFDGRVFDVAAERMHALHLLRHFVYFGAREMRVLLEALYRDIYRYPIVQQIRHRAGDTLDSTFIADEFAGELRRTRFIAMGNPSESGSHLMYYFRQVNSLPKGLFVSQHELASGPLTDPETRLVPHDLTRIVFLDDLLGSGQQATSYSRSVVRDIRAVAARDGRSLTISYYTLFAKSIGLDAARRTSFDDVRALHEIDESQMAFAANSRVYHGCGAYTSMEEGRALAEGYGSLLTTDPLGYRDGQLLLGFQHNVPDNTLPIFWFDEPEPTWEPIFPRFQKVY